MCSDFLQASWMLTMAPCLRSIMPGKTALSVLKYPLRFTSMTRFHSSGSVSQDHSLAALRIFWGYACIVDEEIDRAKVLAALKRLDLPG